VTFTGENMKLKNLSGFGIGMVVGIAIGVALDEIIPIGIPLGIALAFAFNNIKTPKDEGEK
jgi:hypothetical protein